MMFFGRGKYFGMNMFAINSHYPPNDKYSLALYFSKLLKKKKKKIRHVELGIMLKYK